MTDSSECHNDSFSSELSEEAVVKSEQDLWAGFVPSAWSDSISDPASTFAGLYRYTTNLIEQELALNQHDVILEVGCGTGEVISSINTDLPRIGTDINPTFVKYCESRYDNMKFALVDATDLVEWWKKSEFKDYKSPLILCCNNTMNIIPQSIRYRVIQEMRNLCQNNMGRVLVSFWNGRYFSHGVRDFYMKNPALCGEIDVDRDIDWKTNTLQTASGYHSQWLQPEWVMRLLKCYDLPDPVYSSTLIKEDCVIVKDLGIFVFFTNRTSGARDLFDSADEQKYYSVIWGLGKAHLGRYTGVKLSKDPIVLSSQVVNAQNVLEDEFCEFVRQKIEHCDGVPIPCRFLDLGCGYGGLLRKFKDYGFLRDGKCCTGANFLLYFTAHYCNYYLLCILVSVHVGVGVDFSAKMCQQCVQNNRFSGMENSIEVRNESFLDTSLQDEVVDVCVSLEAFMHVGVERHKQALQEAYRVLRPGGWLLFSDLMECPGVDAKEMQPFYERLNVSKLGSVTSYTKIAEEVGFKSVSYVSHSEDVSTHYDAINRMVVAFRKHPDPAKRLDVSQRFYDYVEHSTRGWAEEATGRIEWGVFRCRKV